MKGISINNGLYDQLKEIATQHQTTLNSVVENLLYHTLNSVNSLDSFDFKKIKKHSKKVTEVSENAD